MAIIYQKKSSSTAASSRLFFSLWWWRRFWQRGYRRRRSRHQSDKPQQKQQEYYSDETSSSDDEFYNNESVHLISPEMVGMMETLKLGPETTPHRRYDQQHHRRWTSIRWMQLYLILLVLASIAGLWIYLALEFNSVQDVLMRTFGDFNGNSRFRTSTRSRSSSNKAAPDPYIFEASDLPTDARFIPTISNGHIATSMYDSCMKMNALYNGAAGFSHPACIPSPFKLAWKRYSHFSTPPPAPGAEQSSHRKILIGDLYEVTGQLYQLDVRAGVFNEYTNITVLATGQAATIVKRSFMHRAPAHNRIFAVQILFESRDTNDDTGIHNKLRPLTTTPLTELILPYVSIMPMILTSNSVPTPTSDDLDIAPVQVANIGNLNNVCLMNGTTKASEYDVVGKLNVSMVWTCASENDANTNVASEGIFRLRANQTTTLLASVSVTQDDAVAQFVSAFENIDQLFELHAEAWSALWSSGRIEVDATASFNLSRAVAAAQYYLWSDIRLLENDVVETNATPSVLDSIPFMGLAPGGLAKGAVGENYQGHIFWDMDTWMFPGILWTQPLLARQLIRARAFQLDAAIVNAQRQGDKGARFPWESARSGWEVSPWNVSGVYEIHVSCDVAMALKLYIETTGDIDAVIRYRFGEMAYGIAQYWMGRSVLDVNGTRHIIGVCPPDEYHAPVNDSVYTNFCAAKSLLLPQYLCDLTPQNMQRPDYCAQTDILKLFSDAASALVILTDTYQGQTYHPEFAGFVPFKTNYPFLDPVLLAQTTKLGLVKQADVIMLQYPLMANETLDIQRSDLNVYEQCTDFTEGPAMTWGIFAVNFNELNVPASADRNFIKQYANIVPTFGMWSEAPAGVGAVNFLTGMGGFLQSIINGYFGYRVDVGKYAQMNTDIDIFNCFRLQPRALPGNIPFNIVGLNFQNTTFNVEVTDAMYTYVTLNVVPQNVKQVQICDKLLLMSSNCRNIVAGQEVVVASGVERFICLTFV